MANGTGAAEIDFGAFPGSNEASIAVTGQADIGAGSKAESWVMGDDTSLDHTASDHKYLPTLIAQEDMLRVVQLVLLAQEMQDEEEIELLLLS